MPIKRRRDKRRANVPADAWNTLFLSGHDYLGDLDALGLPEPLCCPPDSAARERAEAAWREAARAAWGLYGAAYMRTWQPTPTRALPWAAEAFGLPKSEGASHAD